MLKYFLVIFYILFAIKNGFMKESLEPRNFSEYSINKQPEKSDKDFILNSNKTRDLILLCQSHMNIFYHNSDTKWLCSVQNLDITLKNLSCFCSLEYPCSDTEQFSLEPNLVLKHKYLNENLNSVYKNECEQSLNELTNETNWKCELQFDRIKERKFYCECKRDTICQRHKYLTLPKNFEEEIKIIRGLMMLFFFL